MLPLSTFASDSFRPRPVTFFAYVAINGFLSLVVVELQVAALLGPLAAGAALIPITVMSVLLSTRVVRMTERTGVRPPIAAGLAVCTAGCLLAARFDEHTSYVLGVLPATTVFGLGLALLVGLLTSAPSGRWACSMPASPRGSTMRWHASRGCWRSRRSPSSPASMVTPTATRPPSSTALVRDVDRRRVPGPGQLDDAADRRGKPPRPRRDRSARNSPRSSSA